MKHILATTALLTFATAAAADTSDRYNDLRFDSAVGHAKADAVTPQSGEGKARVTFSARNADAQTDTYAYANPLGVGPHNDSR